MALLFRLALVALLLSLAGCSSSSLYFLPYSNWMQTPYQQQLTYEDIVLVHRSGLRLHGWWLPAESAEPLGTVYFLHGNAENISTHLMAVSWLPSQGYNVFLLDYRGYGYSEGKPSLPAVFNDIQLGLNWLQQSGRSTPPLIVYGQSLGAAMSAYVLAQEYNKNAYQCAVLEASFTDYREIAAHIMGQTWLRVLKPAVLPMLPNKWAPEQQVAHIDAPLLIIHSEKDEIIPYEQGERLFRAASDPKALLTLQTPHIGGSFSAEKQEAILTFWQEQCYAAK